MLIAVFAIQVSVVLCVLAPEIILVVLGENWQPVILPLRILSIGMFFRTSYKMSDSLAQATGAVYNSAWRQTIYAVLVVVGVWLGARWDLGGVAAAVTLAIFIKYVLMAELSLRLLPLGWGDFIMAHMPGLLIGGLIGSQTLIAATLARYVGLSPILVLALSLTW